ncbi:ArsA family ATPase, partial [Nocardia flavorosea]|uniref:ArsA family ATPase n=1 Tax=Nocardia flavorosea TaxID=53429 RepID=UPI0024561D85
MRTRVELFVGKGGVGKTTLACAQAMGYAREGQRVLVASLDQAHSLGDALGFRFAHDPGAVPGIIRVVPGLDVIELDSLALLEDRFREIADVLAADPGHDHGLDLGALDPAELTGLPGVQELLMLVEITQYAADDDWDVIVLDCPPTADMLRILTAPDTLLGYLDRIWPPHQRMMSAIGTDLRRAVLGGGGAAGGAPRDPGRGMGGGAVGVGVARARTAGGGGVLGAARCPGAGGGSAACCGALVFASLR